MRIDDTQKINALKKKGVKPSQPAGSEGFSSLLTETDEVPGATSASPAPAPGSLLAVPSFDTMPHQQQPPAAQAHAVLDELEALRLALLEGRLPATRIRQLAANLEQMPPSGDPKLQAILDDIALRAAVELAKLDAR